MVTRASAAMPSAVLQTTSLPSGSMSFSGTCRTKTSRSINTKFCKFKMSVRPPNVFLKRVRIGWIVAAPHIGEIYVEVTLPYILYLNLLSGPTNPWTHLQD